MAEKKTLEDFLTEALEKGDIEFKAMVSDNGGVRKLYLISDEKDKSKNKITAIEVRDNTVKLL